MARRIARSAHLFVAWLLVIGLVVQIFLAGLGVFAGASNWPTHRDTGYFLQLLPFLLIIAAAVGRLGRRQIVLALVIFALFFVQSILVAMRDSTPAVAALHPVNGFLILYLAIQVARDAWAARSTPATAEAPSLSGGMP
jgi:mercuric ion transport protein